MDEHVVNRLEGIGESDLVCERCGAKPASKAACRTMYADDSMNRSPILCAKCTVEYNEYWDDMWSQVPQY